MTGREKGLKTNCKLLVLLLDTGIGVNVIDIVGEEGISRILRDNAKRNDDSKPPAVALGSQEVDVTRATVGLGLHDDGLLDLAILELHGGVVDVPTAMVLGENLEGLLGLVLADEEARRFRDPPDAEKLNDGRDGLNEGDRPPAPVIVDLRSTPADDGNDWLI